MSQLSSPPSSSAASPDRPLVERRVDLDWVRIIAFGLLIFYHVGMFYVTWDFHVKSSRASDAIEPLMLLTNPWRLLLLFVVSGVATRFMLDKMNVGRFLASRTARLLIPLVFGMFVIVPPQTYMELLGHGWTGSFFGDFYPKYATASGNWCGPDGCLITPTWNHLWFVAYLFIFTLLVVPVGPLVKRLPAKAVAPLLSGPLIILLPWAFLWVCRMTLYPAFGDTHALVNDWYVLAVDFAGFLFGYAVAKHERFFETCERLRWLALGLALAGWFGVQLYNGLDIEPNPADPRLWAGRAARELEAWCAILAAFGFARRHLRRDGPVRRYLTDAIFPFYIIHQTTIVVAGPWLDRMQLPLWIEAPTLIALTAASCWLGYEIVRRIPPLRPLFGLKLEPRREPAPAMA
jgi:glucan biosynthesis protein C